MKLKAITGIVLTVFLASMLTLAFNVQPVKADSEILYSVDHNLNLVTIDPVTCNVSVVGYVGYGVESLCFSPNGILYASADIDAGLHMMADTLITIDRETGNSTIIGPIGYGDVEFIAFAPDGTLYGADTHTDLLIKIDPLTGAGTQLGPTSFPVIGGGCFSPDGILYGADVAAPGGGPSTLLTINTSTGAGTEIGPIGFNTTDDIAFTQDGTLYGISVYSSILSAPGTGELITIDPTTGIGTAVGPAGAGDFEGLAVYPPIQFAPPLPPNILIIQHTEERFWYMDYALNQLGIPHNTIKINELAAVELSNYDIVLVGSVIGLLEEVKPYLDAKASEMEAWVVAGGSLGVFEQLAGGVTIDLNGNYYPNPGSGYYAWMPGNPSFVNIWSDSAHIVDPTHPITQGLTDADLSGWWTSPDGYFSSFPGEALVVQAGYPDRVALFVHTLGSGKILGTSFDPDVHSTVHNGRGQEGINDAKIFLKNIIDWLSLPSPQPVGGNIVPVDKLELLLPYIGIASIILVTITVAVKNRKIIQT